MNNSLSDFGGLILKRVGSELFEIGLLIAFTLFFSCQGKSPVIEPPPGMPSIHSIVLTVSDQIIEVGGATAIVFATLLDEHDNPYTELSEIRFTITSAPAPDGPESPSFEYPATEDSALRETDVLSDADGIASVTLYSGTAPGPVRIRAVSLDNTAVFAEEHLVTVIIGGPAGIVLGADDSVIVVGAQSTMIHATIIDEFGNNAGEGIDVRFQITDHPGTYGADLPSFEYPASEDSFSHEYQGATNENGVVDIELFSGYDLGWVVIRGTVIENESISVEEPLVLIGPDEPAYLSLARSFAVPYGDSLRMTIGFGVWDQYANPAGYGDTIYMNIEPDTIVNCPEYVIIPEFPDYPDSIFYGTNTEAVFSCEHTFDMITVIASIGQIADTMGPFPLPMYNGDIFISADPGNIWISPPDSVGYSDIAVKLIDGNGCTLSGGIIYFESYICGEISGPAIDTTDFDGFAYTRFMIRAENIPGPPPDPPQCTALVRANLHGYPDTVGEVEIICTRPSR